MNSVLSPAGLPAYLVLTSNPSVPNHSTAPVPPFGFVHLLLCSGPLASQPMEPLGSRREFIPDRFWLRLRSAVAVSPSGVAESDSRCVIFHLTLLRTGCSLSAASHLVLPRRSCLRFQAGEPPPDRDFHPAVCTPSQAHDCGSPLPLWQLRNQAQGEVSPVAFHRRAVKAPEDWRSPRPRGVLKTPAGIRAILSA